MNDVCWYVKHFNELNTRELYEIIALREAVFVVEQDCPYQDVDGRDLDAFLVWGADHEGVLATARILKAGVSYPEISIGRVCTSDRARGKQLGKKLVTVCIDFIENELQSAAIRISAQTYLLQFYEELGFKATGKEYLEDGIPHSEMLR